MRIRVEYGQLGHTYYLVQREVKRWADSRQKWFIEHESVLPSGETQAVNMEVSLLQLVTHPQYRASLRNSWEADWRMAEIVQPESSNAEGL